MNEQEIYSMPAGEELKSQNGEFSPLPADDYIVKVTKIDLEKKPVWIQASHRFDYTKFELQYTLICLPYKLKAEEWLRYINWKEAKPLSQWIWRWVPPFSMGTMKNWDPSFMRWFAAYAQGYVSADANTVINMPGIIVLNKNDDLVSDEETKSYKEQMGKFKNTNSLDDFPMKLAWYKHIYDIRSLEWKYVWARVTVDDKWKNKITWFTKLPAWFTPDKAIEAEAMIKFNERYQKVLAKRQEKELQPVSTTDETVNPEELPF